MRRLPTILGILAGVATLIVVGPVGLAVALLRSSSDAQGPTLAAQLFIGFVVLTFSAGIGFAAAAFTRLVLRLLGARRP